MKLLKTCAIALLAALPLVFAAAPSAEPRIESVLRVDAVSFRPDASNTQMLLVTTQGTVNSGGWANPRLRARSYPEVPADGVLDVDFVAEKPDGMVTQALQGVSATLQVPADSWIRGVRVHAKTNTREMRFGG